MLHKSMICSSCGRDYRGDDTLKPGDACPADDCPSHWEEKGREHPEHPGSLAEYRKNTNS